MEEIKLKQSALNVLGYIINHGSITGQEAIRELHMTELRSRISELKRAGYPIADVWEQHKNTDGTKGRHKRYRLESAS